MSGVVNVFKSSWWSVVLPPRWVASEGPECVTLRAQPPLGALQISAARKETDVTDEDLHDIARESAAPGTVFNRVNYRHCSGIAALYVKQGVVWQYWWLRAGHLMVYATYNVVEGAEDLEKDKLERILASLTPV